MDLYNYRKMLTRQGRTEGAVRKRQSDIIMEATWDRDLQSKKCYIYDYFHDDQRGKNKGMTYSPETTKTPVDLKFIITQYGSLSKDQIEYHVQFKPSWRFEEPAYMKEYETKFQAEIPIGAYVDIPDDQGIYHKWLICSKEIGNQFIKYSVLPCNYYFHWVCGGKKYDMWGVARLRSSYNSGVWQDYIFQSPENQDQMWLPMNDYTKLLYYDQRIIISTQAMERPITWKVSKVENIHPFGINKLTLSQCKFDPNTDKKVDGWWYADYAAGTVEPMPEPSVVPPGLKLSYTGTNPNIKIGGAEKKYTADFAEGDLNWSFMMENRDIQDRIQVRFDDNSCYISTEDEELVGRVMTIYVTQEDGLQAEIKVGFINL